MRPRLWDLAPLRHPLWWAALAVLLVNDNLLKGGGVVPGWLTGKLSDFAFLVVAPVLAAVLVPRVVKGGRAVAVIAVVVLYVAADLSTEVSAAVVAAAGRLGMGWRLWPDPTDLLAVGVLPLTWRVLRRRTEAGGAFCERAGVVIGAFACLATSAPPTYPHHPFLVNATNRPQEVTLTWLLRKVDCQVDVAELAATLNPGDLDDPHPGAMASGDVAALDRPPKAGERVTGTCQNRLDGSNVFNECVGILVRVKNGPAAVVVSLPGWSESENGAFFSCSRPPAPTSRCQPKLDPKAELGPDALALRERGGKLTFTAGGELRMAELDADAVDRRPADPSGCRVIKDSFAAITDNARSCATDSDCRATPALPIPGGSCDVFVNASAPDGELGRLAAAWERSCVAEPFLYSVCGQQHPAVCRAGACGELCGGVTLPYCPPPCSDPVFQGFTAGGACDRYLTCGAADGTWCSCVQARVVCKPPALQPGCPLPCLETRSSRPDAAAPARDAGMDASASPDSVTADGPERADLTLRD